MALEQDLRCYVCGQPLEHRFVLVSMSTNVDRVFVVDNWCIGRIKDIALSIVVERADPD